MSTNSSSSYIGSLIEKLFTDAQHQHLNNKEKYGICLTLLHVHRDPGDLAQCRSDSVLWSRLLASIMPQCPLACWDRPLSQCGAEEVRQLYGRYHLAGHPLCSRLYDTSSMSSTLVAGTDDNNNNNPKVHHYNVMSGEKMRDALQKAVDIVRSGHGGQAQEQQQNICEQYYQFHAFFTANYNESVKRVVEEYKEARCSHLCDKQASPLYRYQRVSDDNNDMATFCSLECRDRYVALLQEV